MIADALVGREERLLVGVDQHRHHDALEQVRAAQDDVDVPVGQRVERPGKDGQAAVRRFSRAHRVVSLASTSLARQ